MKMEITKAANADRQDGQPRDNQSFEPSDRMPPEVPWSAPRKVAFRFVFSYVVLYLFPLSGVFAWLWGLKAATLYESLWHGIVAWFGAHVLNLKYPITIFPEVNGGSDTTYEYVKVMCFLIIAAVATIVWSMLDRKRISYAKLDQWIRVYVRVVLASAMLGYGADKVIPVQMPPPSLSTLMQPFGDLTPYRLSWSFIGASPVYEVFGGALEMLGGILLLVPGMATLGALVSLGVLSNVFMLNMCYGIPVKFWALHLILFACFLLLPNARPLLDFFVLNREVEQEHPTPLFRRRWLNYSAWAVQWALGIYVIALTFSGAITSIRRVHSMPETNPLYGIWRVDEFAVDGQLRPPLLTDSLRWQRMIFTSPKALTVQEMNGQFSLYAISMDTPKSVLWLKSISSAGTSSPWWTEFEWKGYSETSDSPGQWRGDTQLSYNRSLPNAMILEGQMNGHRLLVTLKKEDRQFALKTRGFHWINDEYDFFNEHVDEINRVR